MALRFGPCAGGVTRKFSPPHSAGFPVGVVVFSRCWLCWRRVAIGLLDRLRRWPLVPVLWMRAASASSILLAVRFPCCLSSWAFVRIVFSVFTQRVLRFFFDNPPIFFLGGVLGGFPPSCCFFFCFLAALQVVPGLHPRCAMLWTGVAVWCSFGRWLCRCPVSVGLWFDRVGIRLRSGGPIEGCGLVRSGLPGCASRDGFGPLCDPR